MYLRSIERGVCASLWISKEGDVRRRELLDAAIELFYEKGYDNTSVNDIIARVGVSKGAFYYYFASKDEVLQTIGKEYTARAMEIAENIAADENLNAVEKFNAMVLQVAEHNSAFDKEQAMFLKILSREENLKLIRTIFVNMIESAHRLYQGIIEQGVKEGVFNTSSPAETAELFIHVSMIMKSKLAQCILESRGAGVLERKLAFYEEVFERILGAEKGSLHFAAPVLKYAKPQPEALPKE
jgi:AcrR family transcriptional regulator